MQLYVLAAVFLVSLPYCISFHSCVRHSAPLSTVIFNKFLPTRRITQLRSLGDPDDSPKARFMRIARDLGKQFDRAIFEEEGDFPGLTFLTPVEWAPWMETIWFGNYYDYRSAFFQDVMYSNNKPFREGAVLFRDKFRALQMALLYQRYKKFDDSSYSVSNATFFNVFGTESLRIGRYKVPQSDSVVLCTTDPLTVSQVKRYLNSFNVLKWFKSMFFQQIRKRQYVMDVKSQQQCDSYAEEFFPEAVHRIEYGRMLEDPRVRKRFRDYSFNVPIVPMELDVDSIVSSSTARKQGCLPDTALSYGGGSGGGGGGGGGGGNDSENEGTLLLPVLVANSQYLMENLWQSVLELLIAGSDPHRQQASNSPRTSASVSSRTSELGDAAPDTTLARHLEIIVGGDGRLLNSFALETLMRVFAANGVGKITMAKNGAVLSMPIAKAFLRAATSATAAVDDPARSFRGDGGNGAVSGQKVGRWRMDADSSSSISPRSCKRSVVAVLLTAGPTLGGIRGNFGVQVALLPPVTQLHSTSNAASSTASNVGGSHGHAALPVSSASLSAAGGDTSDTSSSQYHSDSGNDDGNNDDDDDVGSSCTGCGGTGVWGAAEWRSVLEMMSHRQSVRIVPERPPKDILQNLGAPATYIGQTAVSDNQDKVKLHDQDSTMLQMFDTSVLMSDTEIMGPYVIELKQRFQFSRIKSFIEDLDLFITIDCQHGIASSVLAPLLPLLGLQAEESLLNGISMPDYNGKVPAASSLHATTTMKLFKAALPIIQPDTEVKQEFVDNDARPVSANSTDPSTAGIDGIDHSTPTATVRSSAHYHPCGIKAASDSDDSRLSSTPSQPGSDGAVSDSNDFRLSDGGAIGSTSTIDDPPLPLLKSTTTTTTTTLIDTADNATAAAKEAARQLGGSKAPQQVLQAPTPVPPLVPTPVPPVLPASPTDNKDGLEDCPDAGFVLSADMQQALVRGTSVVARFLNKTRFYFRIIGADCIVKKIDMGSCIIRIYI